jgi:hypothetical protein
MHPRCCSKIGFGAVSFSFSTGPSCKGLELERMGIAGGTGAASCCSGTRCHSPDLYRTLTAAVLVARPCRFLLSQSSACRRRGTGPAVHQKLRLRPIPELSACLPAFGGCKTRCRRIPPWQLAGAGRGHRSGPTSAKPFLCRLGTFTDVGKSQ